MNNLILFGLLIVLLVAAQFSAAKTAEDIIDKYLRAIGGKDKLAAIRGIYMEGVKEMMGEEVIVKITKQQDKLSRTELETLDAVCFVLITDTVGWTYFSHRSPAAIEMTAAALAELQTELDIVGPLLEHVSKGHTAELIGKDTVEGATCYKIKLTHAAGNESLFWIDTGTYLLTQSTSGTLTNEGGKKDNYTFYKDYKDVNGIQFAHTVQTKTQGTQSENTEVTVIFNQIVLNPPIDPALFLPSSF